jgi:hypothetical protein
LKGLLSVKGFITLLLSTWIVCASDEIVNSFETNAAQDAPLNTLSESNQKDTSFYVNTKVSIPEGMLFGTFAKEDGPFLIEGNVIVPSGEILTFGPGCIVYIGGPYTSITVYGQLMTRGTPESPVQILSAKSRPNPWDWDRIYCHSLDQSVLENTIIKNSNYGLVVENGNVALKNCKFQNNSLYGLVVKNSEVNLANCLFTDGHSIALNLKAGANVTADSLSIKDNVTGISCEKRASLKMTGGIISRNVNGFLVSSGAQVSSIGTDVTKNKYGVVADMEVSRRMRELVFGNYLDVKVVSFDELKGMIKEPPAFKNSMQSDAQSGLHDNSSFTSAFSVLSTPQEESTNFIGNVTTGFSYYKPKSFYHPNDTLQDSAVSDKRVLRKQTKYLGEQTDKWYGGLQPELQLSMNGKRGGTDINLQADMYGNQWLSTNNYIGKNMVVLQLAYAQQNLTFGDFFESGSETSISGRQMTGMKFSGGYFEMGSGVKRLEFKLAAGESEIQKDSGTHELNIFNTTVDSGMSIRQQITYVASGTIKPTSNSTVSVRGLISRDQTDNPIFRKPLEDPGAPAPIEAQTGVVDGSVNLLKGKLELSGEIDLGSNDTINKDDVKKVAWYNPKVNKAAPAVFKLLNPKKFKDHYAATFGAKGNVAGYSLNLSVMQLGEDYFSAGNPYLENDRRRFMFTADKIFMEKITTSGFISFEQTSLSEESPVDMGNLNLRGEYSMGETKPGFTLDYTGQVQRNSVTERLQVQGAVPLPYDKIQFSNMVSLEGKQNLANGINYSLRYQFLFDKDMSDHPIPIFDDIGDRFQNQISGAFGFKVKKLIQNKSSIRFSNKKDNKDSLRAAAIKISDQLTFNPIPRKLTFVLDGEYNYKKENRFDSDSLYWLIPLYTKAYTANIETKYSISDKLTSSLKIGYDKSYDELTGSGENYRSFVGGIHVTYLF